MEADEARAVNLFDGDSDDSTHCPDTVLVEVEANRVFEDLFGYRQKSARRILEQTFDTEMKMAALSGTETERQGPAPPQVQIRYRGQNFHPPAHDVFGDAVHTLFQKLMSKGQPADLNHWMSYVLAADLDSKQRRKWQNTPFREGVYETEMTDEAKKTFTDGLWKAADRVLCRNAHELPLLDDKWTGIHVSADSMRGLRHKQEDRFVAYPNAMYMNRTDDPTALLAVFDGHGGNECAHYAAGHFWEEWLANKTDDLESWLTNSLKSLDVRMTVRCMKEFWKGGSTAVCAAIDLENQKMAFAWLGDSPGYVMSNLDFRKITREHSPKDPSEARRVEQDGGQLFVIGGELRVNGVLNLTRALGDYQGRPMISNEPESTSLPIERNDYLVLLACDGISDVLNEGTLYELVEQFVKENPVEDFHKMARFICQEAYNKESADNLTVVIGFLRPPCDVWNLMNSSESESSSSEEEEEEDLDVEN